MKKITLGDVDVVRIEELQVTGTPSVSFPTLDDRLWDEHEHWLAPDHWDPVQRRHQVVVQTWVLESAGKIVVIDTGVGNEKTRPGLPGLDHLHTSFLDDLRGAGFAPEDVDLVVNTHIHVDHVGWNTMLQGEDWVPTFPNARYLIPEADILFWDPANPVHRRGDAVNAGTFGDSVAPLLEAGVVQPWNDTFTVDENLTLVSAPGHTPGQSYVSLASGTDRALFIGDMLHTPLQVLHPETCTSFDEDDALAVAARRSVLARGAEEGALVFPAHLRGAHAMEVAREGDSFGVTRWAEWTDAPARVPARRR